MDAELERYRAEQARAYLARIRESRRAIAALKAQADAIREDADSLKGLDYSAPHVSAQPNTEAVPDAVQRLCELAAKGAALAAEHARAMAECAEALDALGGWQAALLRLHYMAGKSLAEIGGRSEWECDRRQMSRLHRRALAGFYDFMPAYERDPKHPAI